MDKKLVAPGLLVKVKEKYIKSYITRYGSIPPLESGKVYSVKNINGSRIQLVDPETNKMIGEAITSSNLDITSRDDLADTIENQAMEMIERAKILIQKSERLKKYESDEEEIAAIIEECINRKLDSKQVLDFLKESNIEIKYKE